MITSKPPKLTRGDLESKFQNTIAKWLRAHGCIVWKLKQDATTEAARPDLLALKEGLWLAIETKKSKSAKYRPGQKERIEKLNQMSWARVAYPENWEEIQKELEELLK